MHKTHVANSHNKSLAFHLLAAVCKSRVSSSYFEMIQKTAENQCTEDSNQIANFLPCTENFAQSLAK